MLKFFSPACNALRSMANRSIFTKKKIVGSLLLFSFLVGIGLSLPNPHKVEAELKKLGDKCDIHIRLDDECEDGLYCAGAIYLISSGKCTVDPSGKSTTGKLKDSIGDLLLNNLMAIPLVLSGIFSWFAGETLRLILKFSTEVVSYTNLLDPKNVAVAVGWPIVRNIGNMVIVLSLITIAIAVILRLEIFGDRKKLLARLIIAALLINFSLVICGVVIDASNITMKYALLGGKKVPESFLSKDGFKEAVALADKKIGAKEASSSFITRALGQVSFNIVSGIVAFLFVFLFVFRIVALWMLVILSPLAFACAVLPFTRDLVFKKWQDAFLQWCFIGIFGALFIYLGNKVGDITFKSPLAEALNSAKDNGVLTNPEEGMGKLVLFFLPGAFMVMGFTLSIQLSAMGAGGAIAMGKWVKNKTVGAVKGTVKLAGKAGVSAAGAAAEKTGLSKVAQRAYDKMADNRLTNWTRDKIYGPGASNAARLERGKARIDKSFEENIKHENDVNKLVSYRNKSGRTNAEKAVIDNRLAEMGSFSEIGKFKNTDATGTKLRPEVIKAKKEQQVKLQRAAMENMATHGRDVHEIIKKSPGLAGYDPDAFTELKSQRIADGEYTTDDAVREELVLRAQRKADLAEVSKSEINLELIGETSYEKLRKSKERMGEDRKLHLKDLLTNAPKEIDDARAKLKGAVAKLKAAPSGSDESKKYLDEVVRYQKLRDRLILAEEKLTQLKDEENQKQGKGGGKSKGSGGKGGSPTGLPMPGHTMGAKGSGGYPTPIPNPYVSL